MDKNAAKLKSKSSELLKYFTSIQTNFPDFFLYLFGNEKDFQKLLLSGNLVEFANSELCESLIATYFAKLDEFKAKSDTISSWEDHPSDEFLQHTARSKACIPPIDKIKLEELKQLSEAVANSSLTASQAYQIIGLDPAVMELISKEIQESRQLGKDWRIIDYGKKTK